MNPGRGAKAETTDLQYGMDFRQLEYRREVFLRFYEFHLKHRSHPGAVYYLMPWLAKTLGWSAEQKLWFAYINGNTQNPVTSWVIFRAFPELANLDITALSRWFEEKYERLEFDTDRRYFKKRFIECVANYRELLRGRSQVEFFAPFERLPFEAWWDFASKHLRYFGRLSIFSYSEYLKIMGVAIDCPTLFLRDISGSRSHRNGLCKVLGRDDLDWHESNPGFDGVYSDEVLSWLEEEAAALLDEAAGRFAGRDFAGDVCFFTLESTLCTYKSWHRPNRRYPNVYNDMLYLRILKGEKAHGEKFDLFWKARAESLPPALRVEDNPADCGLSPAKQNHYLNTGEPVMMHQEWPCFRNAFNDAVARRQGV